MSEADVEALFERVLGPTPIPKPKLVVTETRNAEGKPEVIRDADVVVSPNDVNARRNGSDRIAARRPDPGWLKPTPEEQDIIDANRARMTSRHVNERLRKEADPFSYGHWSNPNE